MDWQYTPYVFPLLMTTAIAATLALFAWRHRSAPGAAPLAALMLAVAVWSAAYALELGSPDLRTKTLWSNLTYLGVVTAPLAWLALALQHTGNEKWLTRRRLILLAIIPLLTTALVWTNDLHHLLHTSIELDTSGPYPMLDVTHNMAFWAHTAYCYLLLLIGTGLLILMFIRSPHLYRGQAGALLIGALSPWIANAVFIFGWSPFGKLDLTPFALTLTGLAMGWGLFRFRLLDLVPVARDTIIESMSDGVIVLDSRDRIVDLNPVAEGILSISASEAVGQPAQKILSRWPDLVERYRSMAETRAEITVGKGIVRRYFDLRVSPLRDWRRHLVGRLIVLRDVTRRKEMEEELQQAKEAAEAANQAKDEFISIVTHELRSPLSSVLGSIGLLEDGAVGPVTEEQIQFLRIIESNTTHMAALASDLADISRIESGQLQLETDPISMAKIIQEIIQSIRFPIERKEQQLILQIPGDLPEVWGDHIRLSQVLTNLISNAHKFTPEGGRIVIRAERAANRWDSQGAAEVVHIVVEDNGIGIKAEDLQKLFQKFSRVGDRETRRIPGTGLGLSIAKNLVELQDGRIWCESEMGKGSAFHFTVPVIEDTPETRAR
ncbi:MAG: PAS domain S-box protein [Anaerolineae bacterium]|nr:PAS domain S-box protein [Anaerolineae bacterium]